MALTINISINCTTNTSGPMSRSGSADKPRKARWNAATACTVTFPQGYFKGYESNDLVITFSQAGTSGEYELLSTAPTGNATYQVSGCPGSGPPDPPFIVIDN